MKLQPVRTQRYFTFEDLYSDVDWTDLDAVVGAFEKRIRGWYLHPARSLLAMSPHNSFPVVALCCLLIDTLSQFKSGSSRGDNATFKRFVTTHVPALSGPLPSDIGSSSSPPHLTTYEEVLYHGFRCGILHEAHIPLYGAIVPQSTALHFHPSGITKYADGSDCPTVTVDAGKLLDAVEGALGNYIGQLRIHMPTKMAFTKKFEVSFGIKIIP